MIYSRQGSVITAIVVMIILLNLIPVVIIMVQAECINLDTSLVTEDRLQGLTEVDFSNQVSTGFPLSVQHPPSNRQKNLVNCYSGSLSNNKRISRPVTGKKMVELTLIIFESPSIGYTGTII